MKEQPKRWEVPLGRETPWTPREKRAVKKEGGVSSEECTESSVGHGTGVPSGPAVGR